ncbi:hypothetical protein Prum_037210 [Phytohabitans rumicis]|uniref:Uncharacterized protein n=1 Tax=Phytohabitans rumicis TaxID=1076125 RepID=A0A6V8L629_9ACTN|nr:hypothetical protein Prum_037210 [Phytohabitans rumicis]
MDPHRSGSTGTPGLSSICRNALIPVKMPNRPAASSSSRVEEMEMPRSAMLSSREPPRPTRLDESAMASISTTRTAVCTNANTRPRTSSPTSPPSRVTPDRNAIPAPAPTSSAPRTAMVRWIEAARTSTEEPASTMLMPNQRRRDRSRTTVGPSPIPTPNPTKSVPKSR